ncbi:MAG: hypothetical protein LBF93_03670 [Zoogloeaceae bacterium]|jgi:hypothetical protein|nr:hypothetical protein [Zoogloeaceae bacterium]
MPSTPDNPNRRRFLALSLPLAVLPLLAPSRAFAHTARRFPGGEAFAPPALAEPFPADPASSSPSSLWEAALNFARQNQRTVYEQALQNGPCDAFLKNPRRFARQIALAESSPTILSALLPGPARFNRNLLASLERPPSGSWIDVEAKTVEQVKTTRPENNEKPRLCVMLDYLAVMNPGKKIVPIQFTTSEKYNPAQTPFTDKITLVLSENSTVRSCLDLTGMKIWVFKKGEKKKKGSSGEWKPLDIGGNFAKKKEEGLKENETEQTLTFVVEELGSCLVKPELEAIENKEERKAEEKGIKEQTRMDSSEKFVPHQRVLQAFCEIPLNTPDVAGAEDLNCDDKWVFPLAIGVMEVKEDHKDSYHCYFHRPYGEKGEVPDWWFRAKYFEHKGYIPADEAIRNKKDSSDEGSGEAKNPYET